MIESLATLRRRAAQTRLADPASILAGMLARPSIRSGTLSLVDQAVVSAAAFLTTVIVARTTSPQELGIYYLALTLVLFARGIQGQVITAPYVVYCHRRSGLESAVYAGSVVVHQLVLSALAGVCVLGVLGALTLGIGPPALKPAIAALALVLPLILLREFGRIYQLSHLNVGNALLLDTTGALLQLGALVVLVEFARLSAAAVYLVLGGAAAVVCLQWLVLERGRWRIAWSRIGADFLGNWSFARWALASHLVGSVGHYLLPWIVLIASATPAAGKAATGRFGACSTLAGIAGMFVIGLGNYISPLAARTFARHGRAALCQLLGKTAVLFLVVVGSFCLLCLAIGDHLVQFVYGSEFAGTGAILAACGGIVLANSITITSGAGLWAIDRPRATLIPDACALVVALAAAAFLVGPLGPLGAALAGLAGESTSASMKSLAFVRLVRRLPHEMPEVA